MYKKLTYAFVAALLCLNANAALYTAGHGDIGLGEGTELEPHIHIEQGGVVNGIADPNVDGTEYEPDELQIVVPQSTFDYVVDNGGRTAGANWDPIGVSAGEGYFFLPQSNGGAGGAAALGAPFLGIGAEEVTPGHFDNNELFLTLTGATMPSGAQFSMWQDGLSPTFYMSTTDGISGADLFVLDLDFSDHDHVNYGFTTEGIYELTFEVSATVGGLPESASATYTFVVPEPSTYGLLAGAAALVFVIARRSRRK